MDNTVASAAPAQVIDSDELMLLLLADLAAQVANPSDAEWV